MSVNTTSEKKEIYRKILLLCASFIAFYFFGFLFREGIPAKYDAIIGLGFIVLVLLIFKNAFELQNYIMRIERIRTMKIGGKLISLVVIYRLIYLFIILMLLAPLYFLRNH
jgi:hypothetical protein